MVDYRLIKIFNQTAVAATATIKGKKNGARIGISAKQQFLQHDNDENNFTEKHC